MRKDLPKAKTVIVKVGTTTVLDENDKLDLPVISRLLREMVRLHQKGIQVVLVSSGAVGMGRALLGIEREDSVTELQAAAAVGQAVLMNTYNSLIRQEGYTVAQLLLTQEDFQDRQRYLNVRNAFTALHKKPVLPVVNENDPIATVEIRFGDNDGLAALISGQIDADVTILFSDVDGFILDGKHLGEVEGVTQELYEAVGPGGALGRGGMTAKLKAVDAITRSGGAAVIANGKTHTLSEILSGEDVGTFFYRVRDLDSRARWLQGLAASGTLHVDAGGVRALVKQNKSLLAVGLTKCEGAFNSGDTVNIVGPDGAVAKGLVNYPADDIRKILGKKTGEIAAVLGALPYEEVVHRGNLVLL